MVASPGVFPFFKTYCDIFPKTAISVLHDDYEQIEAAADEASSLDSSLSLVDHAAMEFFSAVFMWFDTLASVSTGRRPQFADTCAEAFGAKDSKVRLRNIMGCENWVMIIIRDIAVLDGSRRNGQETDLTNDEDITRKHFELKERLQLGLAEPWESHLSLLTGWTKDRAAENWLIQATPIVTHIFACAAMVYLTVVVSGPDPYLPEIRDAVAKSLDIFNALPNVQMLRSLLWPFCITGCMAQKDQESLFTNLALQAGISIHDPSNSWRAVQVMEACWQIRSEGYHENLPADWFTAMSRLGYQVLLV
jgi:hypothetical protein